jgi:mRNA interferase RelE/StbE
MFLLRRILPKLPGGGEDLSGGLPHCAEVGLGEESAGDAGVGFQLPQPLRVAGRSASTSGAPGTSTSRAAFLDDPQGIRQVLDAIDQLADDPRPAGSFPYGSPDLRRLRVGRYGVLYEITEDAVAIRYIARACTWLGYAGAHLDPECDLRRRVRVPEPPELLDLAFLKPHARGLAGYQRMRSVVPRMRRHRRHARNEQFGHPHDMPLERQRIPPGGPIQPFCAP